MEGLSAFSSARRASTALETATSLAPDCLETWSRTQFVPSMVAMVSGSVVSRATVATSVRRMVPPVGRARIMLATSSTV